MAIKRGLTRNSLACAAAVHRFPQAEATIQRLIIDSEDFHELCTDLADAQIALAQVPKITAAMRRARRKEWEDVIETIATEISKVLSKHGCEIGGLQREK